MKNIIVAIIGILLFLLIFWIILYKHSLDVTQLNDFQPFLTQSSQESLNKNIIKENLPTIDASVAFYPLASKIVENIYVSENYTNELNWVSTAEAYENIVNGKVDAIIVSQPSREQIDLIKISNKNLKFVPFAKEALIFYVNEKNSIDSLTIEEIQKIYLGEYDKNITTYQLEKNNGSQTCFETIVENNTIDKKHIEIKDMVTIIESVVYNPNSIAYAFNSFYTKVCNSSKLKLISINGVEPTKENIITKEYPLLYDVYFVYDEENSNPNLKIIEEWLLSEEGQELIKNL